MFRTADGSVGFRAIARRGMPQGSPESPMLYAALVEDIIEQAEHRLMVSQRPAGVRVDLTEEQAHQVELNKRSNHSDPTQKLTLTSQTIHMNWARMQLTSLLFHLRSGTRITQRRSISKR